MLVNWQKIYKQYKGLWVALKEDETTVVASGRSAKEALQNARKKGYSDPILTRMPNELMTYVGLKTHEI